MNNNYYVFTVIDVDYIDVSIVFLELFTSTNPNVLLHIHCLNFSNETFNSFKEKVSRYSNILLVQETSTVVYRNSCNKISKYSYYQHVSTAMFKLEILARKYKPYMMHLDVDILVRKDISELFLEYSEDIVALYEYSIGVFNVGVCIIHSTINFSMDDICQTTDSLPEEVIIAKLCKSHKELDLSYNSSRFKSVEDPHIFHFLTHNKPWSTDKIDITRVLGNVLFKYYYEWYDVYDRVEDLLSNPFKAIVQSCRTKYLKYLNIENILRNNQL